MILLLRIVLDYLHAKLDYDVVLIHNSYRSHTEIDILYRCTYSLLVLFSEKLAGHGTPYHLA